MRGNMKIQKRLWIALVTFGLFAIVFSTWIYNQSTSREKLSFDGTVTFEATQEVEGEVKTENMVLPEEFNGQRSLLFKTTHTAVEVLLDGEEIYQYGRDENTPKFLKSPGSCWHIVDLPENSAGKKLEVRILPVYSKYYGNEFSLSFGTRGDCILRILKDSFGILLISCGILFSGTVSLILYFSSMRKKNRAKSVGKNEILLNLGIFSLLIAIWSLQQCGFMQFLIPDGRTLYFVDLFPFCYFRCHLLFFYMISAKASIVKARYTWQFCSC